MWFYSFVGFYFNFLLTIRRVLNWMMDNARENSNSGCADSDKSSSHKQRSRPNASASSSTPAYKSG